MIRRLKAWLKKWARPQREARADQSIDLLEGSLRPVRVAPDLLLAASAGNRTAKLKVEAIRRAQRNLSKPPEPLTKDEQRRMKPTPRAL